MRKHLLVFAVISLTLTFKVQLFAQAELTVSGITADDKTYDGNSFATLFMGSAVLVGVTNGDIVTLDTGGATGAFADANAAEGKTVTVSGLALEGVDSWKYSLTQPTATASITKASLIPSVTASNKVYDGTMEAAIASRTLDGVIGDDDVSLTGGTAIFANKHVGTGKTVIANGLSLSGADAGNYMLVSDAAQTSADIIARPLTVIATAGIDKVYDGTTAADVVLEDDRLSGDDIVYSYTATFADKHVGTNKTVSVTEISLSGFDGGDYVGNTTADTTASITVLAVTVTAGADTKTFDGTTDSAAAPIVSPPLGAGDTATLVQAFDNKNVGTDKTLTPSGLVNDGNGGSNYVVSFASADTGVINAAPLTPVITADNKAYDGTTAATIASRTLVGIVGSDDVSLTGGTATFADQHAGTGKTVTATGLALDGVDVGNYELLSSSATTTANVATLAITVTAATDSKTYDGTTTSAATPAITSGSLIGGDTAGFSQHFANKNAGTGKALIPVGSVNDGNSGGNYTVAFENDITGVITGRALTVSASGENKVYDRTTAAIVTLSDDRVGGDSFTTGYSTAEFEDKTVGVGKTVNVSGISVTGTDAGNYTFNTTATATATITAVQLTVSGVTANHKAYDGNATAVLNLGSASLVGVISGDIVTLNTNGSAGAFADASAGTGKTVVVSGLTLDGADAGNYSLVQPTTVANITRAVLTVTADDLSRAYGADNPALTVSYTGFLGGDHSGVLSGAPELSTSAEANSPVANSPYAITVTGGTLSADNYDFAFVNGSLVVTQAVLTITADDQYKVYSDPLPSLTSSYSGFVNGEDANVLSGEPELTTGATAGSGVAGSPYVIAITNGTLTASNYSFAFVSGQLTVIPVLVIPSVTASNKVYDGTMEAPIASRTLDGVIGADDVSLSGGMAIFANKHVGTGKVVIANGLTLAGVDAANYVLITDAAQTSADILARPLTVVAAGIDKVYDGTTAASVTLEDDRIAGDDVIPGYTANFADKHVGADKLVTVSGITLSGFDGGDYVCNPTANTTANIAARAISVSATADSKTYDGTAASAATPTVSSGSLGAGDTAGFSQVFDNKNVGAGKTLTPGGAANDGNSGNNYVVSFVNDTNGVITAASLTATITADHKVYDGTTAATILTRSVATVIGSDDVSLIGGTATFADKHAGSGKTVTATGLTLSGADAANYALVSTSAATTANITSKALVVSATGTDKVYDGTTNASVTLGDDRLLGDDLSASYTAASFADKHVGTNKTVNVSGIALSGPDSGNYSFNTTAGTTANITTREITVTATADSKTYDATAASLAVPTVSSGSVAGGDAATLSQVFDDKNVGTGKTLTPSGSINDGNSGNNYAVSFVNDTNGVITAASLTPTITADHKVYDGTTDATILTRSVATVLGSDDVSLTGGTATFADKHAGSGKTVTATGLTLSGADAANYALVSTSAATTANITAKALVVSALGIDKVYDGTTNASTTLSDDRLLGDDLSASYTAASFADKHVGTNKIVNVGGIALSGPDSGDYSFNTTAGTTANITTRDITVTATADSKTYDATAASLAVPTVSSGSVAGGDAPTLSQVFDDKNVGTGKTLTPSGSINDGNSGNNYAVSFVNDTNGVITAASLTATITADHKVYDGTTDATILTRSVATVIGSDDVSLIGGTATFADKHAGSGKTVTATGLTLSGADAANYALVSTSAATTANITSKALVVSAIGTDKVYDGTTNASVTLGDDRLLGDDLSASYTAASFADKHVGTNKTVNVSGIALSGPDSGNYSFNTTAGTTANITTREITVTATADSKTYDATAASLAVPTVSSGSVAGGDAATLSQVFDDKNVGTGKTLTPSGSINDGNSGNNYAVSFVNDTNGVITAASLTATITADHKVYDGTTDATILTRSVATVIGSDDVSLIGGTATFADKHAGSGKTVTATGLTLSGADAANYALVSTSAATTANITARTLVVSALGIDKVYDGTTNASVTLSDDRLLGDDLSASYTAASFADKHVGTNKTVSVSGIALSGPDSGDYSFNPTAGTTANITIRAITVTATADSKTYDGTAASLAVPTVSSGSVAGGDAATLSQVFDDKNVGTGKTLTPSGSINDGNSGNNYAVSFVNDTNGVITAASLTATITADHKVYDGTTDATILTRSVATVIGSDDVSLIGGTATFADKHAGSGKTVTATGLTLSGADAANYALVSTSAATTANITAKTLVVSATGIDKVYDGTTNASVTLGDDRLLGDDLSASYTAASFADKHVGTNKTVNVGGIALSGPDSGDYSFNPTAGTTANITIRAITVTATADSKTYDGTAASLAVPTVSSGSVAGGDAATLSQVFDDKNVGTGKTLTPSGSINDGNSGNNYAVSFVNDTNGVITAASLTATITADHKVYDGTTDATILTRSVATVIGSDDVSLIGGTATFADKHAGSGKTVTATGLTLSGADAANYALVSTSAATTANITAKTLVVSATGIDKVYDGTTNASVTLGDDRLLGDDLSASYTAASFADKHVGTNKTVNVGGIALSGPDSGDYSFNTTAGTTADITTRAITVTATADSKTYNGTAVSLAVPTVSSGSVAGGDAATLSQVFDDKNVGTGKTLTPSGSINDGNSGNNYVVSFVNDTNGVITAASLTPTITANHKVYDGLTDATIASRSLTGVVGAEDVSLTGGTASFADKDVGSGKTVTATGLILSGADIANYSLSSATATTTADITKGSLIVTAEDKSKVYGTANPTLTASYSGFAPGDDQGILTGAPEINTTAAEISSVGNYPVTAALGSLVASNYSFSFVNGTLTISQALLTVTADSLSRAYGAANPALTVTYSGFAGSDNTQVLSGTPELSAGADTNSPVADSPFAITVTGGTLGATNYNFTFVNGTLVVTQAVLTVTANNQTKVYGASVPPLTASYSGFVNGEDTNAFSGEVELTTAATAASGVVGSPYVIAATNGTLTASNYAFAFINGQLTVTAAAVTPGVTADSKVYDGTTAATIASRSLDGVIGADDVSLAGGTAAFDDKHVGTGKTVTVSGLNLSGLDAANYSLVNTTTNTTASIAARGITVTATADARTYDGTIVSAAVPTVSSGSLAGGDTASLSQVFDTKNAGTGKALTPSGSINDGNSGNNYVVGFLDNTNGVITAASLTPGITAGNKVYDGTATATILTRSIATVLGTDDVSLTGGTATFADQHVGSSKTVTATGFSLSGADAANYTLSSPTAATTAAITKGSLTVTADNKIKVYGAANPTLTVSYSGFVSGDDQGVLSGTPDVTTSATESSPTGEYPVTAALGSLTAANYDLTFVNGTLTVSRAVLTVTADDATRSYGATNPVFTASYSGFVGVDDFQVLSGAPELSTSADTNSPVGGNPYSIVVTNGTLTATNYNFVFVDGSLVITQAVLMVMANDQTKLYGAPVPTLTDSYWGFVNGENSSVLSGESELTVAATADSSVGDSPYTIVITNGTLAASNYLLAFVNGQLTVTHAALTPAVTVDSKVYDGTTAATIASRNLIGVIGADDVSLAGGTATFADQQIGTGKTVTATGLNLSGVDAANYSLVSTSATATADIIARGLAITATGLDKVYDGTTNAGVTLADNRVLGDDLSTGYTAAGFADQHVGTNKPVSVSGITLLGADAGNYTFNTSAVATASITVRAITVTAATDSRAYDGTTTSAAIPTVSSGSLADDDTALLSEVFDNKNVGTGKTLTPSGSVVDGNAGNDYSVSFVNATNGVITAASLTPGITAAGKVYDGTTAATILTRSVATVLGGEDVSLTGGTATFADKHVGSGKTVTAVGLSLSGADAGNYSLASTNATATADITKANLTVTADDKSKTQGLPNPPLTANYAGFVGGDGTNVLTSLPALSTVADANSPVGPYAINATAAAAVDYDFNYVDGTLTVSGAPQLTEVTVSGDQLSFSVPTIAGQQYQVEYAEDLAGAWTPLGEPILGTGGVIIITNEISGPLGFFRLNISLP